jgi:cell division cycle 20-like protein 1, cofactor of APC complex
MLRQVCGLKWAPDDRQLASGGNDNKLYCWSAAASQPVLCFDDHQVQWRATPHSVRPALLLPLAPSMQRAKLL